MWEWTIYSSPACQAAFKEGEGGKNLKFPHNISHCFVWNVRIWNYFELLLYSLKATGGWLTPAQLSPLVKQIQKSRLARKKISQKEKAFSPPLGQFGENTFHPLKRSCKEVKLGQCLVCSGIKSHEDASMFSNYFAIIVSRLMNWLETYHFSVFSSKTSLFHKAATVATGRADVAFWCLIRGTWPFSKWRLKSAEACCRKNCNNNSSALKFIGGH